MAQRARSTPYAILGMLSIQPMSGYDIRKESESSIGYFWSESYGQIYPALRDLATRGLIKRRAGRRGGNRDRHVYEITDLGLHALQAWRAEPPRPVPVRNELLLKLFFGKRGAAEPHEAEWVSRLLADETAALRKFRAIRRQLQKEQREHPSLPFWLMTVSYGEHRSRAVVRWCRQTLNALRALESGAGRKGHAR